MPLVLFSPCEIGHVHAAFSAAFSEIYDETFASSGDKSVTIFEEIDGDKPPSKQLCKSLCCPELVALASTLFMEI